MKILCCCFLIAFSMLLGFADQALSESGASVLRVDVVEGRISVEAEDVGFRDVLSEIEAKSGIRMVVFDDVEDKAVSLVMKGVPRYGVGQLLERLGLDNYAVAYDKSLGALVAYVLPKGKDLSEVIKGKSIISQANFASGEGVNKIKGREIVESTKGPHSVPIRYVKDEILIRFHLGVTEAEIDTILEKHNLDKVKSEGLEKVGFVKAIIPDDRDVIDVLKEIRKEYEVKAPEPNYVSNVMTSVTDPLYSEQWYVQDVKFDEAWEHLKSEELIKVAVVDSGVDVSHPDLQGKILDGYDFVNDDQDPVDDNGHGTFVTGIIAATGNNIGVKGLYENARIIPIKAINREGIGTYEDVAKGIIFAADNGAKVINLSVGGYAYSYLLLDAVEYALGHGCSIVAAGGNDGTDAAVYPAAYQDVIGVGSTDRDGVVWSLSNIGAHVDIFAPGVSLLGLRFGDDYAYASGSSGSTAIVASIMAMAASERPKESSFLQSRLLMLASRVTAGIDGTERNISVSDAAQILIQKVSSFHDLAVGGIELEPTTLSADKAVFVVVDVQNRGTYQTEKAEISLVVSNNEFSETRLLNLSSRERVVFNVGPLKMMDAPIVFRAKIEPIVGEANQENNTKTKVRIAYPITGELFVLYKIDPGVHQWLAGEAFWEWPNDTSHEIYDYIGYPNLQLTYTDSEGNSRTTNKNYDESKWIIYGAKAEDTCDNPFSECAGANHPSIRHFWDRGSEAAWNDGLSLYDSAVNRAYKYWSGGYGYTNVYDSDWSNAGVQGQGIKYFYANGQKSKAYEYLGHIVHLLADMSVPAHVLGDPHAWPYLFWTGDDNYEEYLGMYNWSVTNDFVFRRYGDHGMNSILGTVPTYTGNNGLYDMFLDMAEYGDDYESDAKDGGNDDNPNHYDAAGDVPWEECYVHQDYLQPKAIKQIAALYKWFWNETDNDRDDDGDGYTENENDCDDSDANEFPGQTWYRDNDNDSYYSGSTTSACSRPSGYKYYGELISLATDCNDNDASINPGASEVCNAKDDNCNNQTDEGVKTTYYYDGDSDGYGNLSSTTQACTKPSGYVTNSTDCDDSDANEFPGQTWYRDSDNDSYYSGSTTSACNRPSGYKYLGELVSLTTDCNDNDASINPGASEVCNSKDDNCNNQTDEGVKTTYYYDGDSDGYGNLSSTTQACTKPSGYVTNSTDCDDSDANEFPGQTWYRDSDNDSYYSGSTTSACNRPSGYKYLGELVSLATDCNDNDASINPGASEVCDSLDNDCDTQVDEGSVCAVEQTYFYDGDGDGYGDPTISTQAISPPPNYVLDNTDCNDGDASVNPGATEVCNSKDDNCDGQTDEGVTVIYYRDADNDGYGNAAISIQACVEPAGYVTDGSDCNDGNAAMNPGASEVCDSLDNDCDSQIDEGLTCGTEMTYYYDGDGDGYGDPLNSVQATSQPQNYVVDNTDCDDNDQGVNPGATEICDGKDNNCDQQIDEGSICNIPPFVDTLPPFDVRPDGATVGCLVNPNGLTTQVWVEWWSDANHHATNPHGVGNGTVPVTFPVDIANLQQDTRYFYECVAVNDVPPSQRGGVREFRTTFVGMSMSITVSGDGRVTSSPVGIACPGTCSAEFVAGSQVQLTAAIDSREPFVGWGGDCAGQGSPCTLTMNTAKTVDATFSPSGVALAQALDAPNLSWQTGGANGASWFGQAGISVNGSAAQSGDISDLENVWLRTTLDGSGTLSFSWKVSSEWFDELLVYVDGTLRDGIGGEIDWSQKTLAVSGSGNHTVEWVYAKDDIESMYWDTAWVDQVVWQPDIPSLSPTALGVFRGGSWFFDVNGNGAWDPLVDFQGNFGLPTDKPVVGDVNGDGMDDPGVFRGGLWYYDVNNNGAWDPGTDFEGIFGLPSDIPVVGDVNGDGFGDSGVFRGGAWYYDVNNNGAWDPGIDFEGNFGLSTDIPVVGDVNGDGFGDSGVFRGGAWYFDVNNNGAWDPGVDFEGNFGLATDAPVVGDVNGDGFDDLGVFRGGLWYFDVNNNGAWDPGVDFEGLFGLPTDVPVCGKVQ